MVFAEGTDIYEARQLIQERLTQAHALPNVSRPPTLLPPLSSSNRVLMIGLTSTELTPIEQSVLARWTVRPQLMGVPGVANVSIWGMRDQQLQVQVDPETLAARKSHPQPGDPHHRQRAGGLAAVFLEASTPAPAGSSRAHSSGFRSATCSSGSPTLPSSPRCPSRVRVAGEAGRRLHHRGGPPATDRRCRRQRGPGLLLVVEKFPGVSTPEVTEGVENALETLRPGLTGISTDTSFSVLPTTFRCARQYRPRSADRRALDARRAARCGCNGAPS